MAAGLRAARRRRPRLDLVGSPAPPKAGPRGAETGPGGELLPQPPARGCGHGRRKELPSSPAGGFGEGKASPAAAGAALPQPRGFSLSLAGRVRVRGAGALRSPFPAPALPEAAHACGLRAAKTREERESGGILRSAGFPCSASWQRGRRNAESAAGSSIAMGNRMQIIKS